MIFQNKKTQKIISMLAVILILLPSLTFLFLPNHTEAQFFDAAMIPLLSTIAANTGVTAAASTTQTAISIKNVAKEVLRQFLMITARRLLARMTQQTINWINSGFHGNPLYLENPKSFFNDIKKTEIQNMVNMFGYDNIRYPYGRDFARNIIRAYQNQLATNAEYSLSRAITDPVLLQAYRTDFNAGGWSAFLVNTQYPQNNYIGFQMLATEELARRLEGTSMSAAQKVQNTLNQGMGFLSPQTCPSNPNYNNFKNEFQRPTFQPTIPYNPPSVVYPGGDGDEPTPESARARAEYDERYARDVANEKGLWQMTNECPGGLVSTTPGSVVGSHIQTAINSKFRQNELAAALGNSLTTSIAAILDALMNKFLSDGLNSLSNAINPADEDDCSFEYFGDRLEQCGGVQATTGGSGACVAYIASPGESRGSFYDEILTAQERAWDRDPALANAPATVRENHEAFRDLVISELENMGYEASTTHNGNCNISPNNLGVRVPGSPTGEIYDVVREEANPSITIREASRNVGRPAFSGSAAWSFITGGPSSAGTPPSDNGNPSN